MLYRDVIDQRDRPGPHTDQVVDVHRDAIDADRVVAFHHIGNNHFGTDAIGRNRQPDAANIDDVGKVADRQLNTAETAARRPSLGNPFDQPGETDIGFVRIDPGIAIGSM